MKKQPGHRKYNVSEADLYVTCMEAVRAAYRDAELFARYGYSNDRIKAFAAQCAQFQGIPGDDELVGDQMICTEKKYQAADKLRTAIRSVMTRVAMKYHDRTGRYRKFGTSKLADMSDPQLLFCGRRVARVARQQIDFLSDIGVNENVIQRVLDACSEFENSLNIQQDKLHDRDIGVERRTDFGNKLYDELIVLADIGKDIWVERDPVKYQQYRLYESNADQKRVLRERRKIEAATPAASL